jgi:hypothetical protein
VGSEIGSSVSSQNNIAENELFIDLLQAVYDCRTGGKKGAMRKKAISLFSLFLTGIRLA